MSNILSMSLPIAVFAPSDVALSAGSNSVEKQTLSKCRSNDSLK